MPLPSQAFFWEAMPVRTAANRRHMLALGDGLHESLNQAHRGFERQRNLVHIIEVQGKGGPLLR